MSYIRLEYGYVEELRPPEKSVGGVQVFVPISSEVLTISSTPLSGSGRGTVPGNASVMKVHVFGEGAYGVAVLAGANATLADQAAAKTAACQWLTSAMNGLPVCVEPGWRVTAVDASVS